MVVKRGERGDKDKGAKRYKCWNREKVKRGIKEKRGSLKRR